MKALFTKQFFLLVFFIPFFSGFSQITFVKGYMINDKGDTLKGEVKINPKKEKDNYLKVFFKDAGGQQKNYKPNKVKGYGFDDNHFVAFNFNDEPMFYKRMTNGPIFLYKSAYEVVVMNETTYDFEYFLYKEGDKKMTDVKEGKFKKQIQEWMSGQSGFANDYKEEKKFNAESAVEVINKYNDWKKSN